MSYRIASTTRRNQSISKSDDISPLHRKTITHRILSGATRKVEIRRRHILRIIIPGAVLNSISDTYTIFMYAFFLSTPYFSLFACFRPRDYLFIRQLKRGPQTNGAAIHLARYRSLLVIENRREERADEWGKFILD